MGQEFNITVIVSSSSKEVTLAVTDSNTINSVMETLIETLHLSQKYVLTDDSNRILSGSLTCGDCGFHEGSKLLLIPDPTGGLNA